MSKLRQTLVVMLFVVGSISGVSQTLASGHVSSFADNITKYGWRMVENVVKPKKITIADLEIVSFLKTGENRITGSVMRQRAKELGANFGQRHAEYLLAHQREIPKEFRDYFLVFPGTVWQSHDGTLGVPYIGWDSMSEQWYLNVRWIGFDWWDEARLIRPRQ